MSVSQNLNFGLNCPFDFLPILIRNDNDNYISIHSNG